MSALQTWSIYISPEAEKLARQLIIRFQIQAGCGLAIGLDVDRFYDNYAAVRVWVQTKLDQHPDNESLDVLPNLFYDQISSLFCN